MYCQNWEIEIDMQQKRMDIEATPGKSIVCLGYDWKQAKINLSSKFLWPKNGLLHMDLPAIVKWYRCMQIQLKSLYAGSHHGRCRQAVQRLGHPAEVKGEQLQALKEFWYNIAPSHFMLTNFLLGCSERDFFHLGGEDLCRVLSIGDGL